MEGSSIVIDRGIHQKTIGQHSEEFRYKWLIILLWFSRT